MKIFLTLILGLILHFNIILGKEWNSIVVITHHVKLKYECWDDSKQCFITNGVFGMFEEKDKPEKANFMYIQDGKFTTIKVLQTGEIMDIVFNPLEEFGVLTIHNTTNVVHITYDHDIKKNTTSYSIELKQGKKSLFMKGDVW